jgi:hypothetical protein
MGSPPGYPTEPPLTGGFEPPPLGGEAPQPVPALPPFPEPAPGRGRWIALWSLVAVAALAAALLGVVTFRDDGTGPDEASPPGPATEPTEPAEPSEPSLGSEHDTTDLPTAAELDDLVAELSAFVEEERGLEFEQPAQVEVEDDEGFHERLFADFDEDAEETAAYEPLYQAAGLLEPGDDLVETLRTALEGAVVGFYDPETEELVVRGGAITPAVRVTVVHELTHALDDQHFDLDRPEYDEADDEIGFGFSGLVEGSATAVENAYIETLSPDELDRYFDEQLSYGIPDVPLALLELIGAPYRHGPGLVAALRAGGGRERLDAAFAEPPRTSEQVLHPEDYLDGEARVEVAPPDADREVVWDGVLGEVFIQLVLDQEVPDQAGAAAEGWGGDWATTWRDGERSCLRAVMVGDTPDDSDELHAAWSAWAATVDRIAAAEQAESGGPVTITSCTDEAPATGGGGVAPLTSRSG